MNRPLLPTPHMNPTPAAPLSAVAWLRPDYADPPAIVVITARTTTVLPSAGVRIVNDTVTGLLADGFTRLRDDLSALTPAAVDLSVTFGPDPYEVTIGDGHGGYLYRGDLIAPDGWYEAIDTSGLLGVVIATGLDLDDTGRDHLADLFLSVYDGTAVGAAVRVRTR